VVWMWVGTLVGVLVPLYPYSLTWLLEMRQSCGEKDTHKGPPFTPRPPVSLHAGAFRAAIYPVIAPCPYSSEVLYCVCGERLPTCIMAIDANSFYTSIKVFDI